MSIGTTNSLSNIFSSGHHRTENDTKEDRTRYTTKYCAKILGWDLMSYVVPWKIETSGKRCVGDSWTPDGVLALGR